MQFPEQAIPQNPKLGGSGGGAPIRRAFPLQRAREAESERQGFSGEFWTLATQTLIQQRNLQELRNLLGDLQNNSIQFFILILQM